MNIISGEFDTLGATFKISMDTNTEKAVYTPRKAKAPWTKIILSLIIQRERDSVHPLALEFHVHV